MGTAALLMVSSLALVTTGLIMAWKRRQEELFRQYGGQLPGPSKSPVSWFFQPLIPTSRPAPHPTLPGKAAHLVAQGSFVRGLQMNRMTADGRIVPHQGIDIAANIGTPTYAAKSGTVVQVGAITGYGNAVIISHSEGGTSELHGHLHEFIVREGQRVTGGDIVGAIGRTTHGPDGVTPSWGQTMGPHLHWEIHPTSRPILTTTARRLDPVLYLAQQGVAQVGVVARPGTVLPIEQAEV